MRDNKFPNDDGFQKVHPTRGTHWTLYNKEYYFNFYGCPPPEFLTNYNIERKGKCVSFKV